MNKHPKSLHAHHRLSQENSNFNSIHLLQLQAPIPTDVVIHASMHIFLLPSPKYSIASELKYHRVHYNYWEAATAPVPFINNNIRIRKLCWTFSNVSRWPVTDAQNLWGHTTRILKSVWQRREMCFSHIEFSFDFGDEFHNNSSISFVQILKVVLPNWASVLLPPLMKVISVQIRGENCSI